MELNDYRLVALDTNLFIYLMEKHEKYLPKAKLIFENIQKGQNVGITSVLLYSEILSKPIQENNDRLVSMYRVFLSTFPNLKIENVTKDVCILAAELRAKYKIKTPDAIFLATAIANKSEVFFTNDEALKRVEEIKVISLEEVIGNFAKDN